MTTRGSDLDPREEALDPAFASAIRARLAGSAFASWMGISLEGIGQGSSRLRLDVEPHHLNPSGIVHGGVLATLLDACLGLAVRTTIGPEAGHVTVQLDVHYLAAARQGPLTGVGSAVHSGSRTGYGEGELLGPDGRLLARGAATFLVLDSSP